MVVYSSAVTRDNPELQAARQRGVPVIPRAEMLAELMRVKHGIAIAGTHGKTTTTSMVGAVLAEAGFDPTLVVGGRVTSLGANARLGQGEFLVAEADESDGSFLRLTPTIAVVTTIDAEHLDYYRDLAAIRDAFLSFVGKVPFYGVAVLCADQPEIQAILPRVEKRVITYGLHAPADLVAASVRLNELTARFEVLHQGDSLGELRLQVPGLHNVANALAARRSASTSRCRSRSWSGRSPASRESSGASRSRGRRRGPGGRRLRPSPDGDPRDAGRRAAGFLAPARRRVPAPPLHPDPPPPRAVPDGIRRRRCADRDRHLSGGRAADPRGPRPEPWPRGSGREVAATSDTWATGPRRWRSSSGPSGPAIWS